MKHTAILISLLYLALISSLQAQQRSPPDRFSVHDLNQDGLLDRYEYSQMFQRWQQRHLHRKRPEFSDIDLDADGYITEDELIKVLNQQLRLQRRYRARERRWSEEGY